MSESQIIAWITANFPSVIVSLLLFRAYQNLKQWADRIEKLEKDQLKMKTKLAIVCKLHTEHHSEDAIKIWANEEHEK